MLMFEDDWVEQAQAVQPQAQEWEAGQLDTLGTASEPIEILD